MGTNGNDSVIRRLYSLLRIYSLRACGASWFGKFENKKAVAGHEAGIRKEQQAKIGIADRGSSCAARGKDVRASLQMPTIA
jgi:hypothetical protein